MAPVSTIAKGRDAASRPTSTTRNRTGCRAMAPPGGGVQKRRSDLCGRHSLSVSTFPRGGDARWLRPGDIREPLRAYPSLFPLPLSPQCFEHLFRRNGDLVDPHADRVVDG